MDDIKTVIKKIDIENIDYDILAEASDVLKAGKMVAFPTETVYGLGADALDENASAKIYEAKGRPSDNPLIVHVSDVEQIKPLVKEIPTKAMTLINEFWPGPMTLVFEKSEKVPYGTTGGLETVAIRMPEHKVARELIRVSGVAIAAPSANTSGRPSPTIAEHVIEDLNGKISLILDGGPVGIGIESTIVDVTVEPPMILRPGIITKEMLEKKIGKVEIDPAIVGGGDDKLKPKAPGMKYRHYAPKANFSMYDGKSNRVVEHINGLAKEKIDEGYRVGVIASEETRTGYKYGDVVSIGSRKDDITISQNLYKVLRDFDAKEVDYIFGETFGMEEHGQAIMNRLLKAAGYQVFYVD